MGRDRASAEPKLTAAQHKALARLQSAYGSTFNGEPVKWIHIDKMVGMALVRKGLAETYAGGRERGSERFRLKVPIPDGPDVDPATIPICPQCGERDRVLMPGKYRITYLAYGRPLGAKDPPEMREHEHELTAPFCNRCMGYVAALQPLPGRHCPDF